MRKKYGHHYKICDGVLECLCKGRTKLDEADFQDDTLLAEPKTEKRAVLIALQDDGYIFWNDTKNWKVSCTVKGYQFYEDGGYKEHIRRENQKMFLTQIQTWAIVIGTAAAGAYGMKELFTSEVHRTILFTIALAIVGTFIILLGLQKFKDE